MAIKGVNPSYFASMPTVALDPKAGKEDPQYAQMLSQAMQNRAAQTARATENDKENAFKAIDRKQQALRDRRSNEISKRNAAVNEAGEARLGRSTTAEDERKRDEETRLLVAAAQKAHKDKDETTFGYYAKELEKRGVNLDMGADESLVAPPPAPSAAPPAAPPIDRTPVGPRPGPPPPTGRFPDAGAPGPQAGTPGRFPDMPTGSPPPSAAPPSNTMMFRSPPPSASFPGPSGAQPPGARPSPADDGIPVLKKTQDMSWIEGKQPPPSMPPRAAPAGPEWRWPAPESVDDTFPAPFDQAGLEAGLDKVFPTDTQILNAYIAEDNRRKDAGLPSLPFTKSLIPGKSLRRRAAESDTLVSPGDALLGGPRSQ
jgi:hypothetical protein